MGCQCVSRAASWRGEGSYRSERAEHALKYEITANLMSISASSIRGWITVSYLDGIFRRCSIRFAIYISHHDMQGLQTAGNIALYIFSLTEAYK